MLTDPVLPCSDQGDRNKLMSFCTLHLAKGSTILSATINSDTIKQYLKAVSSASLNHKQLGPLLDERGLEA